MTGVKIIATGLWLLCNLASGVRALSTRATFLTSRITSINESNGSAIKRLTSQLRMSSEIPSDYESDDLGPVGKEVAVDENEEDVVIRDALKRELLLLASVTNRGECATKDEKDILVDLVTQLEALNPTPDPAYQCTGEWDLCYASTQFFRSSPFFMAIRSFAGDEYKTVVETGFDIHDKATTASRVGRVRQTLTDTQLISEVDLEVGMLPGFPLTLHGTVVTTASLQIVSPDTWEVTVTDTEVKGSDFGFPINIPVADIYKSIASGTVPVSTMKTFYVDEGIRINRDVDDNFYIYVRV